MKVTFLIGNGFDVSCGMRTTYRESYQEYIALPSKSRLIEAFKAEISGDFETWSDFEMGMSQYAHRLNSEEAFLSCIEDYSSFLREYLFKEENRFRNEYEKHSPKEKEIIIHRVRQSITDFYKGIIHNEERAISNNLGIGKTIMHFISFNYTNTFELLLKDAISSLANDDRKNYVFSNVLHIHGTLEEEMVLGVDNESQLSGLPYSLSYIGKCGFIKPFFNIEYDEARVSSAVNAINGSDCICVFGMSLGESDLSWKKAIAKWLIESTNHHIIYYDYDAMMKEKLAPHEIMRIVLLKKEELASKLNIDYETVKSQLHIPVCKVFFNTGTIVFTSVRSTMVRMPPTNLL